MATNTAPDNQQMEKIDRLDDGRISNPVWWCDYNGKATIRTPCSKHVVRTDFASRDPFPLMTDYCRGDTDLTVIYDDLATNEIAVKTLDMDEEFVYTVVGPI
jgi:hypothetical protein